MESAAEVATAGRSDASVPVTVQRVRVAVASAALVAVAFSQEPGRIVGDTKLDLTTSPAAFLARSLSAWDPHSSLGQLQNQAYGYLFPMGPFFLVGHLLHVPPWVIQRLWWSLLLVLAFNGCLRVARLIGNGTPSTHLLAAFAYALSPRVITVLGPRSIEALPLAVLPWVLIPLIHGAGRGPVRRSALRSALAFACIGGVNAAATLAVLPVPALYLVTRERGHRRAALAGWWVVGVLLAAAWWLLPLLVLGTYSFPILDYIEAAATTTSVESLTNVLRGTSHWLAYLPVHGQAFWPAGTRLAIGSTQIIATALVAAAGLAGLTLRDTRERRFLLLSTLAGALVVSVGYAGAAASPASPLVRELLDGPLAAFRNVHKFDAVLRLPLALGLCQITSIVPLRRGTWRQLSAAVAAVTLVALAVATTPAIRGRLAPDGAFDTVPDYWHAAARYVDNSRAGGATLLVPASRFAEYLWGRPMDEPLSALSSRPTVVRGAETFGAPGVTRLLDAWNQRMASGAGSPGLAASLADAGIRYVVVRNDLDPWRSGALPSGLFRSALVQSPGIRPVASFGPQVATIGGTTARAPAVEVFAVSGTAPRAVFHAAGSVDILGGGPEAALALADIGIDDATVAAADASHIDGRAVIVTDTMRRRTLNFGADAGSGYSPTLTAAADAARGRRAADVTPYDGVLHQTVSVLLGARDISASSSAADPFADVYRGPQTRPYSAVDGDPGTAWVSDIHPIGQWLQLDLKQRLDIRDITVRMIVDPWIGPAVSRLEVRTDAGVRLQSVRPASAPQTVGLPRGATRTIRLTVREVEGGSGAGAVGISELSVPGVTVEESVTPPRDTQARTAAGAATAFVFSRPDGFRGNCFLADLGWTCVPGLAQPGEEVGALDRQFRLTRTSVESVVTVRPRPGPALDTLLDAAHGFRASASSRLVPDPAARPGAAFDGDPQTAWVSASGDVHPRLSIELPRAATVRSVRLSGPAEDLAHIQGVVVRTPSASRVLAYHPGELLQFAPVTARAFTVQLERGDSGEVGPIRLAEVSLGGLPAPPARPIVSVPCASGPVVTVDGRVQRTMVRQEARQLLALGPVSASPCDATWTLRGSAHRIRAASTATFDVVGVALGDPQALHRSGDDTATREVQVSRWGTEHRVVTVAAGTAGYLAVAEGANRGWTARVDGRELRAVRLDGWRQVWLLPPSAGPVRLTLDFTPGRYHRLGLLVGVVALLVLVTGAALPERRPKRHRRAAVTPPATGAAGAGVVGRRRWAAVLMLAGFAVMLVGGWGAMLVPLAVLVPVRARSAVAGTCVAAAGLTAAVAGWASPVGQLLCAGALTVAATSLAPALRDVRARLRGVPSSMRGRSKAAHDTADTISVPATASNVSPTK